MPVEMGETKFLIEPTTPAKGAYSIELNGGTCGLWNKCREKFHPLFTAETNGFFFAHDEDQSIGYRVAAFMHKTEKALEIASFKFDEVGTNFIMTPIKSKFSLTTRSFALWVEPDSFWKQCWWKRSLFTILLRCGLVYDPETDNYDDALLSDVYAQETYTAIKRFLFGFTTVIHESRSSDNFGWRDAFRFKSLEEIRKMLVKENEVFHSIIGAGSVWN